MNEILDNKTGNSFSRAAIFAGYVFVVVGVILIIEHPLAGIVIALLGAFPRFAITGVQIDKVNNKYREYISIYGFKRGEWKSLSYFPFICVLSKTESNTTYSRGQVALTDSQRYFFIVLLNENHREKLAIKRLSTEDKAIADAKVIADQLELKFTKYNPPISARTQARR